MSDTEDPNKRTAKPKKAIKARRLIDPKDAPQQKHTTQAERDKTPALSQRGGKGVKRMDLSKVEKEFLQEFFYNKSGYSGRDVLYKQLQAHYEKNKTPKELRISRRRMWHFFLQKQEVNQLHRPAKKSSLTIRPINSSNKLDAAQFDLIIKGGDSLRTYKGIGVLIDVATRRLWTEVLTSTNARTVAKAMDKMLDRVYESLTDDEKKRRKDREANGKSKTFRLLMTDNGPEMKAEFNTRLKELNIQQVYGVSNKSTSQSIVERVNQTLQAGMERERTATGNKEWWKLVQKHTDFYNNKTNRNLRLKDTADPKATYKVYTPNELWKVDRQVLRSLFENKSKDLSQSNKEVGKEDIFQVGDTVRLVDFGKRKSSMTKGFKQSWSKDLYTIFKLKRPKKSESNRPIKFYVKDQESGEERKDANNRLIPYTINDLQKIHNGVEKAPDSVRLNKTPPSSPVATPKPKKPKKEPQEPAPKKKHQLIGVKVSSPEDDTDEGVVIDVYQKGKGKKKKGPYYGRIKWKKPYTDEDGKEQYETEMTLATNAKMKKAGDIGLNEYVKQHGLNKEE
jgi:hypothetical protein